jgi:hypothetical protein
MGAISRDARLCFILLWTIADDSGRLRGNSRLLASLLYPYDDDARAFMGDWLAELAAAGCITRYDKNLEEYIQIENWSKHQKIDKPTPSKLPPFVESSRGFANTSDFPSADQDLDQEGKGNIPVGGDGETPPPDDPFLGDREPGEDGGATPEVLNPYQEVEALLVAAAEHLGEPPPEPAEIRRWLKDDSPLRLLIRKWAEKAVPILVHGTRKGLARSQVWNNASSLWAELNREKPPGRPSAQQIRDEALEGLSNWPEVAS